MIEELKKKIAEFSKIAKTCPENLQEKCFEILLSNYFRGVPMLPPKEKETGITEKEEKIEQKKQEQEDVQERDLHVKAKKFLKSYDVTINNINQVFYKEGGDFKPLYEDLHTTKITESQIRIALLHALKNGLKSGEFIFNGEEVREECEIRKCYDQSNFAAIFKKSADLFDKFKAYKKTSPQIKLDTKGKKKLAELIKELQ